MGWWPLWYGQTLWGQWVGYSIIQCSTTWYQFAVEMLLHSMDRHRTVFKVKLHSSRSLANMVSDPKIQRQLDDKGVQTLLNSLNNVFKQQPVDNSLQKQMQQHQNNQMQQSCAYDKNKAQFAQQMLSILSYLGTDPS